MANMLPHRGSPLPDLLQWFESDWPFGGRHPVRTESYTEDDQYVVRFEIPGVDPDKDIHIMVEGNQLEVRAERSHQEHAHGRTEFEYGSFSRTIALPGSCDTENITANYEAGILTIRMPKREEARSREIPVARKGQ